MICVWSGSLYNINIYKYMLGCERIELFYSATVKSMIGRYILEMIITLLPFAQKNPYFQYTASCVLMFY